MQNAEPLPAPDVVADTGAENLASRRMLERLGFRLTEERRVGGGVIYALGVPDRPGGGDARRPRRPQKR